MRLLQQSMLEQAELDRLRRVQEEQERIALEERFAREEAERRRLAEMAALEAKRLKDEEQMRERHAQIAESHRLSQEALLVRRKRSLSHTQNRLFTLSRSLFEKHSPRLPWLLQTMPILCVVTCF